MKTPEEIRYKLDQINKEIVDLKNQKRHGKQSDFEELADFFHDEVVGLMREESALNWVLG